VEVLALAGTLALALIAQAPSASRESPPADEPAACDAPERAPDPRCNDNLDGRDAPQASTARAIARIALAPPRAAARLALLPVVVTTTAVERHDVLPWLRAVTTSDDGKLGVRPTVQYTTGFVATVGLRVFYRRLPDPLSEASASFKMGTVNVMRGELGLTGTERLGLSFGAFWDRRDDRLFAGIGNPPAGALPPIEARYRADVYRAEALWSTRRERPLTLNLRAGFEGRDYRAGEVHGGPALAVVYAAAPELVPGYDVNVNRALLFQRARLALDLRPGARDASGVEIGLEGGLMQGIAADPSRHARVGVDAVASLGGADRALVFRFMAAAVEPLGAAPVPFDELVSPCGVTGMRGLPDGLLRDRSGMVGTAEYRWLISSGIDATLFVDEGAVAGPRFAGLAARDFHTSFGGGLRFYGGGLARYWEERVTQGVQVAYAPGRGIRLMLTAAVF
jgi:hypothetical protein